MNHCRPILSNAAIAPVVNAHISDDSGDEKSLTIAGEYPLTLYVDKKEVITLMTLGQQPEALAVGWLRNQRWIESLNEIEEVRVDWEVNTAAVYTRTGQIAKPADDRQTVTSGCGQGTMFGDLMETATAVEFVRHPPFSSNALADLLAQLRNIDTVYKKAGAVHGCALAAHDGDKKADILAFVEDIGRHNAVDTIAGWMWLNDIRGDNKVFYTTGRLTSEMVIKCAQMGVPYLVSRSGTTRMGYEIANTVGLTMLGRAINRRYLLFSGKEYFLTDAAL